MKSTRALLIVLGLLFYVGGSTLNLFFSSNLLWGEMEANLFISQSGSKNLQIECPLMIAPWETATISTIVSNSLVNTSVKPQVNAFISNENDGLRVVSQTVELDAFESQPLQWTVDSSDIIFDRLILVSILQRQYRDLISRQGTCSIYVYSLFGLDGHNTLIVLVEIGVLASLLGIGLLYYLFQPLSDFAKKVFQINVLFLVLVLAGLFTALPRLWGLTLIFNSSALLAITVASVDVLFSYNKK